MVKPKFSTSYGAKRKRISRLPRMVEKAAFSGTKKSAVALIEAFQQGIRSNNFKLQALKDSTIQRKQAQGFSKPKTPLYGAGDEIEKKSYINMLRIRRVKKGWKVFASWGLHHSAGIPLRSLLQVHEEGAIIKQRRGDKIVLIRIPPRPAFAKALRRVLKSKLDEETTKEVRAAIREFIRTGSTAKFEQVSKIDKDKRFDEA